MAKYKEALAEAMTAIAADPTVVFIGYGVRFGSKAAGSLLKVDENQLIETPVAENLMAGLAIGLSIRGFKPVVYYERFDFVLNASDAIVNHLDKLRQISGGEFSPATVFRVVVGGTKKPLYTGATHVQDFSEAFRKMVSFPVIQVRADQAAKFKEIYQEAIGRLANGESTMIVEYKDEYECDI